MRKDMRSAKWNYINKIILIMLNENSTKPFWKYVKSTRNENIGVTIIPKDGELTLDSMIV